MLDVCVHIHKHILLHSSAADVFFKLPIHVWYMAFSVSMGTIS